MEQHAVPQHIASFEFKLFGNLTLRQFIFLAVPIGLASLIFFSPLPAYFRTITSAVIAIGGAFIALVPYNGRAIDKWIVIFLKAVTKPTQRIWLKESKIPDFLAILLEEPVVRKEDEREITSQDRAKLIEYLRTVPRGTVSPIDVREDLALERLGLTTEGAGRGSLPSPIFWGVSHGEKPAKQERKKQEVMTEASSMVKPSEGSVLPQSHGAGEAAAAGLQPRRGAGIGVRISQHLKPYVLGGLEKKLHAQAKEEAARKAPQIQLASDANFSIENIIPIATSNQKVKLVHGVSRARARKLHFAPPPGFDLSDLPIRGEARFEVSQELKKRYDREEADKVRLLDTQNDGNTEANAAENMGLGGVLSSALSQAKSAILKTGIRLPQDIEAEGTKQEKSFKKPTLIIKHAEPNGSVSLKRETSEEIDSQLSLGSKKIIARPLETDLLSKARMVPLTDKPNVVSGLITDRNAVPLASVIVIIRDANGIPVRALKTNKLGQFLSVTPLSAGTYHLEVEGEENSFEPISLILTDQVMEPLMIEEKA